MELNRLQMLERSTFEQLKSSQLSLPSQQNPTNSDLAANSSSDKQLGVKSSQPWDAGAFRVVILAKDCQQTPGCLAQRMYIDMARLALDPATGIIKNISLSVVYSPQSASSSSVVGYIDWAVDLSQDGSPLDSAVPTEIAGVSVRELTMRAIVHAFSARQPRKEYRLT